MLSRLVKKRQKSLTFRRRRLEERLEVPLRHHETVPWRDWVAVENPHHMFVLTQNSIWAEPTEVARLLRWHVFKGPVSPVMDLVSGRLEDSERASLLVDLAVVNVNLDAQKGQSTAKG